MAQAQAQAIKFTLHGEIVEGTILANKGICYSVELSDGSSVFAQKKHIVEGPYDITPAVTPVVDPCSLLGTALSDPKPLGSTVPRREKTADAPDASIVTLKQLCFELKMEPRIARRNLRKSQGLIGTGSRWEWEADSDILAEVKALLSAK